jgi:CubicO group peptidase (beta-lactamase class C family)
LLLSSCSPHDQSPPSSTLVGDSAKDTWQMASPETSGFDPQALAMAVQNADPPRKWLHSVLVERHGRLVAERYFAGNDHPISRLYGIGVPCAPGTIFGPEVLHDARSVSKSVVSLLLGTFEGEGRTVNLDDSVIAYFPELRLVQDDERRSITVRDLLTMSSGLDWNEDAVPNDETRLFWKADTANYVQGRPLVAKPGTHFLYNSGGAALVAEIVTRAGGKPFLDLVRERLFAPMGRRLPR